MNKVIKIGLVLLTFASIFLGSWYVTQGDIIFHTDIARDFLLLNELSIKKIILVGPRADWKGLFHGPLWLYFNLPAYLLGKGNPVTVGWFWIFATIIFSSVYFYIIKKLFDTTAALLFIPLFLLILAPFMNQFYNPIGTLLMMPLFFYTAIQYYKNRKILYILLHLLIAGLMIQFQLAVGIPLLILSTVLLLYDILKNKKFNHLFGFLILILPLSTFILFDIRHNFLQLNGVIDHFSGKEIFFSFDMLTKISNRVETAIKDGLGFFPGGFSVFNVIINYFIILCIFRVISQKKNKWKVPYYLFLYYYIGFYLLSLIHHGLLLIHYILPLIFLPILIFSSLYKYSNKKLFTFLYIFIVILNLYAGAKSIKESSQFIGKNKGSWKFLRSVAENVYKNADDKDFGVYIYAPDVYAYAPKYAMLYGQTLFPNKKMHYSKKMKETFLVYEPPPSDKPWLNGIGWKTGQVKIDANPIKIINSSNGYRIEKYVLTDDQIKIPSDSLLEDWISQR